MLVEQELARLERLRRRPGRDPGGAGRRRHGALPRVDLTDADAVAPGDRRGARPTSGKIDVLLHAAGLEISRALADKEPREYDLVFGVKADGWFNAAARGR